MFKVHNAGVQSAKRHQRVGQHMILSTDKNAETGKPTMGVHAAGARVVNRVKGAQSGRSFASGVGAPATTHDSRGNAHIMRTKSAESASRAHATLQSPYFKSTTSGKSTMSSGDGLTSVRHDNTAIHLPDSGHTIAIEETRGGPKTEYARVTRDTSGNVKGVEKHPNLDSAMKAHGEHAQRIKERAASMTTTEIAKEAAKAPVIKHPSAHEQVYRDAVKRDTERLAKNAEFKSRVLGSAKPGTVAARLEASSGARAWAQTDASGKAYAIAQEARTALEHREAATAHADAAADARRRGDNAKASEHDRLARQATERAGSMAASERMKAVSDAAAKKGEKVDPKLEAIAKKHLSVETLKTRNSDSHDFHEHAPWTLKAALHEAAGGRLSEGELDRIAQKHLGRDLVTRKSDSLDFKDHAVWQVKAALEEARDMGKRAAKNTKTVAETQEREVFPRGKRSGRDVANEMKRAEATRLSRAADEASSRANKGGLTPRANHLDAQGAHEAAEAAWRGVDNAKAALHRKIAEQHGDAAYKGMPLRNALAMGSALAAERNAAAGGGAAVLPSANRMHGFWGTTENNLYAKNKETLGIDTDGDTSERHAQAQWEAASKKLHSLGMSPEQAREFLDSRYGRHLADALGDGKSLDAAVAEHHGYLKKTYGAKIPGEPKAPPPKERQMSPTERDVEAMKLLAGFAYSQGARSAAKHAMGKALEAEAKLKGAQGEQQPSQQHAKQPKKQVQITATGTTKKGTKFIIANGVKYYGVNAERYMKAHAKRGGK